MSIFRFKRGKKKGGFKKYIYFFLGTVLEREKSSQDV